MQKKINVKILIIGNISNNSLENYYIKYLKQDKHHVETFHIQNHLERPLSIYQKTNRKFFPGHFHAELNLSLVRYFDNYNSSFFDVVLVFKGQELITSTLDFLKTKAKLLVCYNPDHPFKFDSPGSGNSLVKKNISKYDLYLTYSLCIANELRKIHPNVDVLPFGYDIPEDIELSSHFQNEITFAGAWDSQRENILNNFGKHEVSIYGPSQWSTKTNKKKSSFFNYQQSELKGLEYYSMFYSSLASINILRPQNLDNNSHNMRTFEIPGAGGIMISQYTDEQAYFFEPNKEALYYKSNDELLLLTKELISNKRLQNVIRLNTMKRIQTSNYSYRDRKNMLIALIKKHF